jgi:erythritol transport system ATP-binding protein
MSDAATDSANAETTGSVILSARGITKNYGGVHALTGVDFDARRGKVTVLFGENGAGKSTLMKILSGVEQPSDGELWLDEHPVEFASTVDAARQGVAIIHQELNLCANLSVNDNIFMGRELVGASGLVVDFATERKVVARLLDRLEEKVDPKTLVADLRLGQQQIIEIAKALAGEARVLIMDEPTSALSASEVEVLFRIIDELKADGVAIVYISHHLEEALEVADYAVVLRDGALVAQADAADIDISWVIRHMVGREAEVVEQDLETQFGEPLLTVDSLRVPDPANASRFSVDGLSLKVRAGEMVCLYGLMGAGRTELLETLAGRLSALDGTITLDGTEISSLSIAERIRRGIALVPEDRQRDGLVQTMSVGDNITLSSLGRLLRGLVVSRSAENSMIEQSVRDVRVKTSGAKAPITSLSGGNQQKVVIGKVLLTEPKVLLLDEPTRGIDVGAKAEIFALMAREARKGLAVLYATSEISEALSVANRVIVLSKGRFVREFDPRVATREELMVASGESDDSTEPGRTPPTSTAEKSSPERGDRS